MSGVSDLDAIILTHASIEAIGELMRTADPTDPADAYIVTLLHRTPRLWYSRLCLDLNIPDGTILYDASLDWSLIYNIMVRNTLYGVFISDRTRTTIDNHGIDKWVTRNFTERVRLLVRSLAIDEDENHTTTRCNHPQCNPTMVGQPGPHYHTPRQWSPATILAIEGLNQVAIDRTATAIINGEEKAARLYDKALLAAATEGCGPLVVRAMVRATNEPYGIRTIEWMSMVIQRLIECPHANLSSLCSVYGVWTTFMDRLSEDPTEPVGELREAAELQCVFIVNTISSAMDKLVLYADQLERVNMLLDMGEVLISCRDMTADAIEQQTDDLYYGTLDSIFAAWGQERGGDCATLLDAVVGRLTARLTDRLVDPSDIGRNIEPLRHHLLHVAVSKDAIDTFFYSVKDIMTRLVAPGDPVNGDVGMFYSTFVNVLRSGIGAIGAPTDKRYSAADFVHLLGKVGTEHYHHIRPKGMDEIAWDEDSIYHTPWRYEGSEEEDVDAMDIVADSPMPDPVVDWNWITDYPHPSDPTDLNKIYFAPERLEIFYRGLFLYHVNEIMATEDPKDRIGAVEECLNLVEAIITRCYRDGQDTEEVDVVMDLGRGHVVVGTIMMPAARMGGEVLELAYTALDRSGSDMIHLVGDMERIVSDITLTTIQYILTDDLGWCSVSRETMFYLISRISRSQPFNITILTHALETQDWVRAEYALLTISAMNRIDPLSSNSLQSYDVYRHLSLTVHDMPPSLLRLVKSTTLAPGRSDPLERILGRPIRLHMADTDKGAKRIARVVPYVWNMEAYEALTESNETIDAMERG